MSEEVNGEGHLAKKEHSSAQKKLLKRLNMELMTNPVEGKFGVEKRLEVEPEREPEVKGEPERVEKVEERIEKEPEKVEEPEKIEERPGEVEKEPEKIKEKKEKTSWLFGGGKKKEDNVEGEPEKEERVEEKKVEPDKKKEVSEKRSWWGGKKKEEKVLPKEKDSVKIEGYDKKVKAAVGSMGEKDKGRERKEVKGAVKAETRHEVISLKPVIPRKKNEKVIEQFDIEVDGAIVTIVVKKDDMGTSYNLYKPEISPATSMLLSEVRNELITVTTISMKELSDPKAFASIKNRFMADSRKLLRERLPGIHPKMEDYLVGTLMQEMMGLGIIEFLVDDPGLEEIVIPSAKEQIRVYSKKHGWLITNVRIEKEEDIINYSNIIARRIGRQITVLNPLLDAHLVTGDRINAVLYPINTKGNTITIRKFARDPMTIVDMIANKTCDATVAAMLWLAIEFEMNVLISGGTGSGKTSFLNACMPFISPNQRVISMEDTRELMLPEFLYWTPLVTRTPNPEGKGEVSMLDLLINSLRMRPDRIILGEMRKQKEAMVLFEAMHTGHSVYATVHADSASETISRLVNPPLNIPPNLLKAVHLNVVMYRDRRKGIRRVMQVAEFEAESSGARANLLYRWIPETDQIVKHGESSRFFEQISRHTGMSDPEINVDLKKKEGILSWLVKNRFRSLGEFGKVMNLYYRNKELLEKAISTNKPALIFGTEKKLEKEGFRKVKINRARDELVGSKGFEDEEEKVMKVEGEKVKSAVKKKRYSRRSKKIVGRKKSQNSRKKKAKKIKKDHKSKEGTRKSKKKVVKAPKAPLRPQKKSRSKKSKSKKGKR